MVDAAADGRGVTVRHIEWVVVGSRRTHLQEYV